MAEPSTEPMTSDVFLRWSLEQDERFELVDGVPRMMTGAKVKHDRIIVNAIVAIGPQLRGRACEVHTADIAVKVLNGNVRRPDVTIDCGRSDGDALHASSPVAIIEVLSRTTRHMDLIRKLAEYQALPSLKYLLFLEPDVVSAGFHVRRADGAWELKSLIGRDTDIAMPEVGVTLALGAFYEGTDA